MRNFYLFIDESGNHNLANVDCDFPIFLLCGVIFSDTHYNTVLQEVSTLKRKFWGDRKVILHSRDIRRCEKEFSILLNNTVKSDFYDDINNILRPNRYRIIASAIDKQKFIARYGKIADDPYALSLSFIVERTIFLLDDVADGEKTLHIIIERRGTKEDNSIASHLRKIKARGTNYVNSQRFRDLGTTVTFKSKSEDDTGLQLSDLIAYPIARYVIDNTRANPAFDLIEPRFYKKYGRRYGLKIFP
jgi:hypothetical protein